MALRRLWSRATGGGDTSPIDMQLFSDSERASSPLVTTCAEQTVRIDGNWTSLATLTGLPPHTLICHQFGINARNVFISPDGYPAQILLEFPWHRARHDMLPAEYWPAPGQIPNYTPPALTGYTNEVEQLYPRVPLEVNNQAEVFPQDLFFISYEHLRGKDIISPRDDTHDGRGYVLHLDALTLETPVMTIMHRLLGSTDKLRIAPITVEQLAYLPAVICTAVAADINIRAVSYETGGPLPPDVSVSCNLQFYTRPPGVLTECSF